MNPNVGRQLLDRSATRARLDDGREYARYAGHGVFAHLYVDSVSYLDFPFVFGWPVPSLID